MGQSSSSHSPSPSMSTNRRSTTLTSSSSTVRSESLGEEVSIELPDRTGSYIDYTYKIPDDCLALVFQYLDSGDRKRCSLVSRRWLLVEGHCRDRLTLNAQAAILPFLSPMFSRLNSVTKLSLRCDRRSASIDDRALVLISSRCRRLVRLKLRGCREFTDIGMTALAINCKQLKKFSCGSCMFSSNAMNTFLNNCSSLEELTVKRLRFVADGETLEPINLGGAASSLKLIHLKELYEGHSFGQLISASKKLQSLTLYRCLGDWDNILESIAVPDNNIIEVHLERIHVTDISISALSNCPNLQMLHLVKTQCTNAGVIAVAGNCHYLRKLHIDGWRANIIGNDALIAIAKHLTHLKELILIGINPSPKSLHEIAGNCQELERLGLCGSDTVYDYQIICIAAQCNALKKLCIKDCPVSNEGIEALALGCPNLEKIKVKKCKYVTSEVGDWLRARRGSLEIALDDEPETVYATSSEGGAQQNQVEVEVQATMNHDVDVDVDVGGQPEPLAASSSGRGSIFLKRFGVFGRRGLSACTFGRWSGGSSSSGGGNV